MAGRKKSNAYEDLNYEAAKVNNRNAALCKICGKFILNTAETRLKGHRNVCNSKKKGNSAGPASKCDDLFNNTNIGCEIVLESSSSSNTDVSPIAKIQKNIQESENSLDSIRVSQSSAPNSSVTVTSSIKSTGAPKKKRSHTPRITNFTDRLSIKEEDELNEALAQLVFGCNIPLRMVDSIHFKNFIKKVRPAYAPKLPTRKIMSTKLLDEVYNKCVSSAKELIGKQSVMLIDGWKNSSNNSKLVDTMLHNADGEQAFLQGWDLTGESESAEKLAEIVGESVDIAKELYNTEVYAVVSDNASAMKRMGRLTEHYIWHSNCNSHTGNLLAKDVLNFDLNAKATSILKEFKQADFEKMIVNKGGTRIKLPCDTRWCSHRDAYKSLLENCRFMKVIAADSTFKKVKPNVAALIFNDEFINEVQDYVDLLDPICNLINKCQSSKCSVAEAVDSWLDLKLPAKYEMQFSYALKKRKDMSLNTFALAAYYLDHTKDNKKLSKENNQTIHEFLFKTLTAEGVEEWNAFINNTGFFKTLNAKSLRNPIVYWNMAELKFPVLAELAKKLLQIPASSAQIERMFSSWGYVHSAMRNRLTFDRSKKLTHIYFNLRNKDHLSSEEDEND